LEATTFVRPSWRVGIDAWLEWDSQVHLRLDTSLELLDETRYHGDGIIGGGVKQETREDSKSFNKGFVNDTRFPRCRDMIVVETMYPRRSWELRDALEIRDPLLLDIDEAHAQKTMPQTSISDNLGPISALRRLSTLPALRRRKAWRSRVAIEHEVVNPAQRLADACTQGKPGCGRISDSGLDLQKMEVGWNLSDMFTTQLSQSGLAWLKLSKAGRVLLIRGQNGCRV
jgi:hypothetical protein